MFTKHEISNSSSGCGCRFVAGLFPPQPALDPGLRLHLRRRATPLMYTDQHVGTGDQMIIIFHSVSSLLSGLSAGDVTLLDNSFSTVEMWICWFPTDCSCMTDDGS